MQARTFLVVDNDPSSRQQVHKLILAAEPNAFVYEAVSLRKAIMALEQISIDFLFLEAMTQEHAELRLLELISPCPFEIVYLCSIEDYNSKAPRPGKAHCLLKPITEEAFMQILQKTEGKPSVGPPVHAMNVQPDMLVVKHVSEAKSIRLKEILYLKADNSYTTFFMTGGEKILASRPIYYFEKNLNADHFFRIHKSHLINLYQVRTYLSANKTVLMQNGERLAISRYKLSGFLEKFRRMNKMIRSG